MNEVTAQIKKVKDASHGIFLLNEETRNQALLSLAEELLSATPLILQENAKDLALMPEEDPRHDRLQLSKERIQGIAADVAAVAALSSPIGRILEEKTLPNGLRLQKISVPLGVIGIIYESRPNVTIDVFALCFKAGNACILKGGKEAHHSNVVLAEIIKKALAKHKIDPEILYLMPPERAATQALLEAKGLVDVCIPRGSQALIDFVRDNAKIPVIETGAGIVHTYFDASGDLAKGRKIIDNAKTRRVSVCNALDTLLIHQKRLGDLPSLLEPLAAKDVEIFADEASYTKLKDAYPEKLLHHATPEDFGREFLSYKMSVKAVPSLEEALAHIRQHSSRHSEAIIAEDASATEAFLQQVDAAAVYANASTAFTDGGQFGMGAEIGISTQKLHARGPMGLEALTSYKWLVYGDGQVRG
jgi:glutamate-5-semialdehyde dehydrogenase